MAVMKAIQYLEAGRPEWVETPVPQPGRGQILLEVLGVTTCPRWDLHLMDGVSMAPGGTIDYPTPIGHPGHEAVGNVVKLGDGVSKFSIGDCVALWRDQGAGRDGCYAEFVVADEGNLLKAPSDLMPEAIASLELAMCVEVSFAQILNIDSIEGKRFAVSGLGPAGLVAVQIAKAYGAEEVLAFDPVETRRNLALKLGADEALDPLDENSFPHDRFSPEALDLSIDCTGLPASVEYLMRRTRNVVALFGVLREPVRFGFQHWCRGLHLVGYGDQNLEAAEAALGHIVSGALNLASLVSFKLPLKDYKEGIALLRRKEAIKILFTP